MTENNIIMLRKDNYVVTTYDKKIRVVVGSSVALVIYDPTTRLVGICNFSSPVKGQLFASEMLNDLKSKGMKKKHALIFGGASLSKNKAITQKIGTRNYEFAKYFLVYNKVTLYQESFGGDKGRTLTFSFSKSMIPLVEEKYHEADE